jgi:hypothetical protein
VEKGAALVLKGRTGEGRGGEQHWSCCVGGERGEYGRGGGGEGWSGARHSRKGECGEWLGLGCNLYVGPGW